MTPHIPNKIKRYAYIIDKLSLSQAGTITL